MYLHVNGFNMYYEIYGEGSPLIMIHGNGEDSSIFYKAKEILEKKYRVILLDLRAQGQSDVFLSEYNYDILANDIYEFIMKLQLTNYVIYGFSDGAIISLLLANKIKPKHMILSGVNYNPKGLKLFTRLGIKISIVTSDDQTDNALMFMMLNHPNINLDDLKSIDYPVDILIASFDCVINSPRIGNIILDLTKRRMIYESFIQR